MTSSKIRKYLITILIFTLLISLPLGSASGQIEDWSAEMMRFSGQNRYETSAIVSAYLFEDSEYVVLARGDTGGNYADALAGSYLAGFREAPLLLSYPHMLPAAVSDEIIRLKAKKAYVLGGTTAIHQSVVDELEGLGLEVERLSGVRREDTAAAIVDYVRENNITNSARNDDFAFLVNGRATADALVAGSYSYEFGIPILLVNSDSLPGITGITLDKYGFDFVDLIGGMGVISETLETHLDTNYGVRQRIFGARRYETSVEFAKAMFSGEEHFVFIAGPDANLADGISAAAFGLPILYVWPDIMPSALITYLNTYLSAFSHLFVLGGTKAISENIATQLTTIQDNLPPMITYAYIENEAGNYRVTASINNVCNTITFSIDPGYAHEQFTTGYSNLSKNVYVVVTNTDEGKYDVAVPGRLIETDENFVDTILDLFTDNPPAGANAQTLLNNSGALFTLTAENDASSVRTYTIIVEITSD